MLTLLSLQTKRIMAFSANMNTSYELREYEQLLGDLITKTKDEMNKPRRAHRRRIKKP